MWIYDKKLQFPVNIKKRDPKLAKLIITQYGGPDGELGASLRYLSQRFTTVTREAKAALTDIGTEELGHLEMIGAIVKQLTADLSIEEIKAGGYEPFYVEHGLGIFPQSAGGDAFTAAAFQSKGDPITDLYEDMAAEQKARSTYEYLIDMIDDPDVAAPIRFLREREIVHFQRFGETLERVREHLSANHYF
ncbi:MAG: manganese catalase family protein [Clostridiales bacterium]|jgi:spore coat protein JC|nr:manganese catalase family protein [Clostridiales bacterium]